MHLSSLLISLCLVFTNANADGGIYGTGIVIELEKAYGQGGHGLAHATSQQYAVPFLGAGGFGASAYGDDYGAQGYGGNALVMEYAVPGFGGGNDGGYGFDYGYEDAYGYDDDGDYGPPRDKHGPWGKLEGGYGPEPADFDRMHDGPDRDIREPWKHGGPGRDMHESWKHDGPGRDMHESWKHDGPKRDFGGDFHGPRGRPDMRHGPGPRDFDSYGDDFHRDHFSRDEKFIGYPKSLSEISYGNDGYGVGKNSGEDSIEYGNSDLTGNSLYGRKFIQDGGMNEHGVITGFGGENEEDKFEHVSKYTTGGKIDSYGEKKHKYGNFDAYGQQTRKGHNFLKRKLVLKGKVMSKGVLDSFGKAAAKGKLAQQSKFLKVSKKNKKTVPSKQVYTYY